MANREITLQISPEVETRWHEMMARNGAENYADLIRSAMGYYDVLLKAKADGRQVFIGEKSERQELKIE